MKERTVQVSLLVFGSLGEEVRVPVAQSHGLGRELCDSSRTQRNPGILIMVVAGCCIAYPCPAITDLPAVLIAGLCPANATLGYQQ